MTHKNLVTEIKWESISLLYFPSQTKKTGIAWLINELIDSFDAMKSNVRSLVALLCCSLVPGALALRPRRSFALAEKVAQPHSFPAKSFKVNVKCNPGVDGFKTNDHSAFAGTSDKIIGIRGGASVVGAVTSPAFWLSE